MGERFITLPCMHERPGRTGRALRSHRQPIVVALEGVHLLLDHVGRFADLLLEQLGGLEQGGAHFEVAVALDNRAKLLLEPLPAHGLLWQDVLHPADGS